MARPNLKRSRFQPDEVVVLAVLMGIDGVVADGPAHRPGIEDDRRPVEAPQHGRPTQKRAPVEGEPEHGLRPIAEPLDEGIERHDRQHAKPKPDGVAVEAEQHGKSDQAKHEHEEDGGARAHLSARQWPSPRPRDLGVDVAVDEVVIGAARPAHDDGAHGEEEEEPGIGIGLAQTARGKRYRPEAGKSEQEEADRPVGAGEPEIGEERRRRVAIDPVPGACVGHRGGFALGRGSCHVMGRVMCVQPFALHSL